MLALKRREEERIVITHAGERMEFLFTKVQGKTVHVLLDAPRSFVIHRIEVQERIDSEPAGEGEAA